MKRTKYTAEKRLKERTRKEKADAKRARREGRDPDVAARPDLGEMVERLGQEMAAQGLAPAGGEAAGGAAEPPDGEPAEPAAEGRAAL